MSSGAAQLDPGVQALLQRSLADPHSILGAHPAPGAGGGVGGVMIRALRPEAVAVTAVLDDGRRIGLRQIHQLGVFEGEVPDAGLPLAYRVEADYGEPGA